MSTNFRITHYLLEGMLDGGLSFVASYLERKIGRSIIITDAVGKIAYPDMSDMTIDTKDLFIDIPDDFEQNVYYQSSSERLYYRIRHKSSAGYIIVEKTPPDMVEQMATVFSEAELALKYHFSLQDKEKEDFGQSLWEHFFLKAGDSIPDKLQLLEKNMDINNYYFISVLEVEDCASLDWSMLRSYIYESLHKDRSEYISSIIAPNRLVTILRGHPAGGPMDIDPDWRGRSALTSNKASIEKTFNIKVSMGIGKAYRPSSLLKSFQEACIALALPRLMGKNQFIQYFSQLGVFAIIFSHDIETVKKYCLQVLGKVIEHDEKNGTDFLSTLRILLDNACSWTTTANQLYVHVNTVYYRMLKVEQLLDVDFSLFETRLHLFTAIRAWDTLNICNLLE